MPKEGKVSPINGQPLPRGKPFTSETAREARQIRTANDKAKASVQEEFKKLVNQVQVDKKGNQMLGAEVLAKSLFNGCVNGNIKAIELALLIMGEKPAEKIMVSTPDSETIERVENALFGGRKT